MTNDEGYEVKYKCKGCGEHTFIVRYRHPNEDIVEYMKNVIEPGLGKAHKLQSPFCSSPEADLYLPAPAAAQGIGMRVVQ